MLDPAPPAGAAGRVRLAALATHPIQYHAPWFRALAARPELELEVLFEHLPGPRAQGEGFDRAFQWDTPLLDGYRWQVLARAGEPQVRRRVEALRALCAHLRARRPHAVLLTGWQSAVLLAAPALAHRAGAAVLVRGESNLQRPRAPWRRAAHRALLARYDAFLAIGRRNEAFYRAAGVQPARIFASPYCVDNDWFAARAVEVDRAAARRRFGIPDGALCLLFAGKLERKKRPLDAIAALASLRTRGLHLLLAGSGALEAAAREAARGLPVSFAGFLNQSEMPAAYAAADCLLLPSDHGETWGLVVNEAMACGLPAIVADQVGCAPDLVIPDRTGWIHATGDVAALARCIAAAAADRTRLAAMGAHARHRVRRRHGVERAAAAVPRALRAALAAAPRSAA